MKILLAPWQKRILVTRSSLSRTDILMLSLVFFIQFLSPSILQAQFSSIEDTVVCEHFILPYPEGNNLSNQLKYAYSNEEDAPSFNIGDTIHNTGQLFILDCENDYEECFFLTIIKQNPNIYPIEDIIGCDYIILPIITGDFITPQAAYYTIPDGEGQRYFPGTAITKSITLYPFDGILGCDSQDTIDVITITKPILHDIRDTFSCQPYILPSMQGFFLPSVVHYADLYSGQLYQVGELISETTTLVAVADTGLCTTRDTFDLMVKELFVEPMNDTTVCGFLYISHWDLQDKYVHPWILLDTVLYFNQTPKIKFSQQVCIIDSIPGDSCSSKECFYVEVLKRDTFKYTNLDTISLCNDNDINIKSLCIEYKNKHLKFTYSIETTDIENFNDILYTSELELGFYDFYYIVANDELCDPHIDTAFLVIQLTDHCANTDKITLEKSCQPLGKCHLFNNYNDIWQGGTFYDQDFNISPTNNLSSPSETDTLINYYIYEVNGMSDTTTICIPPIPYIEITPQYPDDQIEICYNDCYFVQLTPNPDDTIVVLKIDLYEINEDTIILLPETYSYSYNSSLKICFKEEQSWEGIDVSSPFKHFYAVLSEGISQAYSGDRCFKDTTTDTIYFSTLANTSFHYNEILCPYETREIGGTIFDINYPIDTLYLFSAASNGCDSTIYVNLNFQEASEHLIQRFYCSEDEFIYENCQRYDIDNPSDTIIYANAAYNGCDSLVIIDLYYSISKEAVAEVTICHGDSVLVGNHYYFVGETPIDTIKNIVFCDSLYITYDILESGLPPKPAVTKVYDCQAQNYTLTLEGSYSQIIWSTGDEGYQINNFDQESVTVKFYNEFGCYDTLQINLHYFNIQEEETSIQLCDGEKWIISDQEYTAAGSYYDTLRTMADCDSIIQGFHLSFFPQEEILIDGEFILCNDQDSTSFSIESSHTDIYLNDMHVTSPVNLNNTGHYYLTGINKNGCEYEIEFDIVKSEEIEIYTTDLINIPAEENIPLPVDYDGTIQSYSWSPATNLSCSDCPYPYLLYPFDGTYEITGINEDGCIEQRNITITFIQEKFYINNVINSQSIIPKNQVLFLQSNLHLTYDLYIYDRWGNKMFHKENIPSNVESHGWKPGTEVMKGVYVYMMVVHLVDQDSLIKGDVTVL